MAYRTSVAYAAAAAAAIAAANVCELIGGSSIARIRDLRVIRLLARAADSMDVNLLASLPRAAHAELNVAGVRGAAALFAAGTVAALVVLVPVAVIFWSAAAIPPLSRRRHGRRTPELALLTALAAGLALPLPPLAILALAALAYAFVRDGAWLRWSAIGSMVLASLAGAAMLFAFPRASTARPRAAAGSPNIILISIDSLRADHLHAYGYARETSPNLDRLASQGALFETAIAPTSWTLPSHMTLMTALPPEVHGVTSSRRRLPADIDTLPQRLRRAGYYTGGIVSATYLDGLFGFSRGFDEYDDYTLLHASGDRSARQVSSPQVTNLALAFLRRRAAAARAGQPFFLFVHMFDVHYDYNPPEPFAHKFDPEYCGTATGNLGAIDRIKRRRDLEHVVALYDGEIAFVDAHIGNLLAGLDALHLQNDTIVAVVADHGEEFFEHGRAGHFKTLYDEVLHVPMIVRYPGHIAPGTRVRGQVRLMDTAPTLLELAGLRVRKPASDAEAMSLVAALRADAAPPLPAFGDLKGTLASLRTADRKLIWNVRTNRRELYDLVHDPREQHAVRADDEEMRDLAARLQQWRSIAVQEQGERIDLDDEEKSALKSLGYLN
jgi:arylsulfatase A-like enzyme